MRCNKKTLKQILQNHGISAKGNKLQLLKKYAKYIALKKKEESIVIEKVEQHRIPMDTSEDNFIMIMDESDDE